MGTYLEDALESMYMLPSEIKRNFDLMRELDKVLSLLLASSAALVRHTERPEVTLWLLLP